jgi:mannan endo-1,4-beta-mannosidase
MPSFTTVRGTARAAALALIAPLLLSGCWRRAASPNPLTPSPDVVRASAPPAPPKDGVLEVEPTATPSAVFMLQGKPFCFSGSNNYYLTYKDRPMVDDVFVQAKAMGLKVMRTWAFIDRGSVDDSVPSTDRTQWSPYGTKQGVYFQYWDTATDSVAYNEGAEKDDGLVRLDYLLAKAAENDIKMVLVLTNNWRDAGGIDQYLKWFDLTYHHQFFSDERAKKAYKDYAAHLINRVNTVTQITYKDDPAIVAWELGNQLRCRNFGQYDRLEDCEPATITSWVKEMSEHIKALDPNHLVAVGDEGFFNRPGPGVDAYTGKDGVDHEAFLALASVDFGTFHLYPDLWSTSTRWGNQWILDHLEAAQRAGKPTVLEEYGIAVKRDDQTGRVVGGFERRRTAYMNWNNLMLRRGGNAAMFWMLVGVDPSNASTGYYPDYDHFSVYNRPDDESAKLLRDYAALFLNGARACELANQHGVTAQPTPFVTVAPAPRSPTPPAVAQPPAQGG